MSQPSLWDWAIDAYARPGVADACLHLQDHHGANVPLLLGAAWAGQQGRSLNTHAAVALTYGWEHDVGGLLRAVRRNLKAPRTRVDDAAREALRDQVKAVELQGERVLLDALADLAATGADAAAGPEAVLADMARAWAKAGGFPPPPAQEIAQLAALICYGAPR